MGEDLGETAERPLDFQPDRTITGAVPFRESDLAVSQSGRSRPWCSAWRVAADDGGREHGEPVILPFLAASARRHASRGSGRSRRRKGSSRDAALPSASPARSKSVRARSRLRFLAPPPPPDAARL